VRGRVPAWARARPGFAAVLASTVLLASPAVLASAGSLRAQQSGADAAAERPDRSTRFSSIDVELGGAVVNGAEAGISYGAGFDVSNFLVSGALTRIGFRFWATEDRTASGRRVEIDDFAFGLMVRKRFGGEGFALVGGFGPSLHLVSAVFPDRLGEKEERDGARGGVDVNLGFEVPIGDDGFASAFAEGTASLVSRVSHAVLLAGIRLHFDRLNRLR